MSRLQFISLLVASLFCGDVAQAQVFGPSDLREDAQLMPSERQLRRIIEIGPATKMNASIEVTAKGNGTLNVGNLHLRVVDEHDDGAFYQDGMAHVEFVDVDGDGWKTL